METNRLFQEKYENFQKAVNRQEGSYVPTAMTNNGGNDTISGLTAMGYGAYYVALEALKAAGSTDPGDVKAALPGVTYTGVSGDIAFDEQGDAIRDTAYIKTADNQNVAWTLETVQTVE